MIAITVQDLPLNFKRSEETTRSCGCQLTQYYYAHEKRTVLWGPCRLHNHLDTILVNGLP